MATYPVGTRSLMKNATLPGNPSGLGNPICAPTVENVFLFAPTV